MQNRSNVWTPLLHAVWKPDPKGRDQMRFSLTRSYRSPPLNKPDRPAVDQRPLSAPRTEHADPARPRRQPRPQARARDRHRHRGRALPAGQRRAQRQRLPPQHQQLHARRDDAGDGVVRHLAALRAAPAERRRCRDAGPRARGEVPRQRPVGGGAADRRPRQRQLLPLARRRRSPDPTTGSISSPTTPPTSASTIASAACRSPSAATSTGRRATRPAFRTRRPRPSAGSSSPMSTACGPSARRRRCASPRATSRPRTTSSAARSTARPAERRLPRNLADHLADLHQPAGAARAEDLRRSRRVAFSPSNGVRSSTLPRAEAGSPAQLPQETS